jgi:hypothetical protein
MAIVLMPAVVVCFCFGTASGGSGLLMAVVMVIMIMVTVYLLGGVLVVRMIVGVVMIGSGNDGEG